MKESKFICVIKGRLKWKFDYIVMLSPICKAEFWLPNLLLDNKRLKRGTTNSSWSPQQKNIRDASLMQLASSFSSFLMGHSGPLTSLDICFTWLQLLVTFILSIRFYLLFLRTSCWGDFWFFCLSLRLSLRHIVYILRERVRWERYLCLWHCSFFNPIYYTSGVTSASTKQNITLSIQTLSQSNGESADLGYRTINIPVLTSRNEGLCSHVLTLLPDYTKEKWGLGHMSSSYLLFILLGEARRGYSCAQRKQAWPLCQMVSELSKVIMQLGEYKAFLSESCSRFFDSSMRAGEFLSLLLADLLGKNLYCTANHRYFHCDEWFRLTCAWDKNQRK